MGSTNFDDVEELRQAMLTRKKMWTHLHEWRQLTKEWQTSAFESIDVGTIQTKADYFTKISVQCERKLPDNCTAVKELKKLVFDFRETMPIVGALGNPNLKEVHWTAIKDVLQIEDQENEPKF